MAGSDVSSWAEATGAELKKLYPEEVDTTLTAESELVVKVAPERYKQVCRYLRQEKQVNYLSSLTAVDYRDKFEVVVHLFAINIDTGSTEGKVVVKVDVSRDEPKVETVCDLWPTANWHEREVYDLFGIKFLDHPDLRRILLTQDFVGHPLRKDFEARRPERRRVMKG